MKKGRLHLVTLSVSFVIITAMSSWAFAGGDTVDSTELDEFETTLESEEDNEENHDNDFALRNGIFFGDSVKQVRKKETLKFSSDEEKEPDEDGKVSYSTEHGKVSGIDDTYVTFRFTDDALTEMDYSFPSDTDRDSAKTTYQKLYDGLSRKYGKPLNNTGGDLNIITTQAVESALFRIALYMFIDGVGDYVDYDEWIVDCDDYKVKIDIMLTYSGMSYSESDYYIDLGYKYFTDDDVLNAVEEKKAEQDEVDNDL